MTTKKAPAKKRQSKPKKVTFMSRYPNLTMIRVAADYIYDARGNKSGKEKPEHGESPFSYSFDNSTFETDDPVAIKFMRDHENFNTDVWEAGAAPDEPKPTNGEQMATISQAAAIRDVEALDALIEDEKNNHDRLPIIQAAEAAISAIEELPTELGGGSDDGAFPSDLTNSDND